MAEPAWAAIDLLDQLGLGPSLAELGLEAVARVARVDPDADSPFAPERALVARARPGRRAEVLSGRALARVALAELGVDPVAIGRRADRSADWPAGVLGSISHSHGWVAVIVAGRRSPAVGVAPAIGLGLDLEVDQVLARAVADRVLDPGERAALAERADQDAVAIFSVKESVFKAVNPTWGRWLEPEDVSVRLVGPRFRAQLAAPPAGPASSVQPPSLVEGGWARLDGWVLAGCVAHATPGRPRGPKGR